MTLNLIDIPIRAEGARLAATLQKDADKAITRALNHYFKFDDGDPMEWDEEVIGELGKLVHQADGTIEFWMGDCHLITFSPMEMSVDIVFGAPLSTFNHTATEHWLD